MAGPSTEIFSPQQRFLSQESWFLTKHGSPHHSHTATLCHPDRRAVCYPQSYLKVIRENCSEARHILDRFHIVANDFF
jgi:hypothetical protein